MIEKSAQEISNIIFNSYMRLLEDMIGPGLHCPDLNMDPEYWEKTEVKAGLEAE